MLATTWVQIVKAILLLAGAVMITGTPGMMPLIWLSPTIQMDLLHHETAWFPLKNPAIVMVPLGFLAGILVSLCSPEEPARTGCEAMQRRASLGRDSVD